MTPVIVELVLAPCGPGLTHTSGQHVLLGDREHRMPERAYSVANAPRRDRQLSLLVTRCGDGLTSTCFTDPVPWSGSAPPQVPGRTGSA